MTSETNHCCDEAISQRNEELAQSIIFTIGWIVDDIEYFGVFKARILIQNQLNLAKDFGIRCGDQEEVVIG